MHIFPFVTVQAILWSLHHCKPAFPLHSLSCIDKECFIALSSFTSLNALSLRTQKDVEPVREVGLSRLSRFRTQAP
ncbi:hypothetical protein F5882DRAFT_410252, partial [Hyaloscypha sp. PMI_1271]